MWASVVRESTAMLPKYLFLFHSVMFKTGYCTHAQVVHTSWQPENDVMGAWGDSMLCGPWNSSHCLFVLG
jgi:hypothetical protein